MTNRTLTDDQLIVAGCLYMRHLISWPVAMGCCAVSEATV